MSDQPDADADAVARIDARVIAHTNRFRKVSNRYARVVTDAYGGDIDAAAADDDDTVAARVAEWERSQGIEPRDWHAIGRDERDDDESPAP